MIENHHLYQYNQAQQLETSQLKHLADGLNIEGGKPYKSLANGQVWANLCVVLDRPFEDGLDFAEIADNNPYSLKEASILSYNEAKVNHAFLTAIHYYIANAQKIVHKSGNEPAEVVIQLHRKSSGESHLKVIEKLMLSVFKDKQMIKLENEKKATNSLFAYSFPEQHVKVDFRYLYSPETLSNYAGADIVLSLSLASGFNEKWKSGDLLLPQRFIPFNIKAMEVDKNSAYEAQNHLVGALQTMLKIQQVSLEVIKNQFRSQNLEKTNQMSKLTEADFHVATLLEVDGLFNPKSLPRHINIKV